MATSIKAGTWGAVWKNKVNYLFLFPAFVMFLIFGIYPFVKTIQLSFFDWDGIAPTMKFIGISNYREVFYDQIWWASVINGLYFTAMALVFMISFSLLLALLVNGGVRGGNIYRVIFYIPPVLSSIVVGFVWKWIFDPTTGILNHALDMMGLEKLARAWLTDPKTVLLAVSLTSIWQGFGYSFLLLLAGLQNIPDEFYEAARVDGANSFKQFRHITLPLLVPVLTLVSILTILGAMQLFAIVVAMTGGGPGYHTEVPALRIYKEAFSFFRFGYASATSIVFGIMLLILSVVQLEVSRRKLKTY